MVASGCLAGFQSQMLPFLFVWQCCVCTLRDSRNSSIEGALNVYQLIHHIRTCIRSTCVRSTCVRSTCVCSTCVCSTCVHITCVRSMPVYVIRVYKKCKHFVHVFIIISESKDL